MMFEHTSRYYKINEAIYSIAGQGRIIYKRRRFLPRGDSLPRAAEVTVTGEDRPDLVTARALEDPEQFWQICDANNAMNPFDMTSVPGRKLKVPEPQTQM
jgi:hypothetical protein